MKLKSKVVIGYCDVASAGCRVLLGADPKRFDVTQLRFDCCSNENPLLPCIENVTELSTYSQPTFLQLNHVSEDVSILVVNSDFQPHLVHLAAAEIIDNLRNSDIQEVVIVAAISISLGNGYYKLIDQGQETELARGCLIGDQLLNNLLQFAKIEAFRTTLVVVDGKRAKENSKANTTDGSEQNIRQIHQFLTSEVSKDFDLNKSLSLFFVRHHGSSELNDKAELMYL